MEEIQKLEHLFENLKKYSESDMYPYHMPGHKRRSVGMMPGELCALDITEIDGFDNLHQPEDIIKDLQEKAAELYGAEESFYLVGGSTCGILAAISSAVNAGGNILMARNCHKSAYHAIYLRNLTVSYLYPSYLSEYDILDAVTPEQVRAALEEHTDIQAVMIVSPTYEGRIANVKEIAEIVHSKGIPLIVDEAHGAHLGLAEGFAQNSCQLGADLVIHSTHKTLPALTQTAILHVNGELIDRNLLRRYLHIYQSSSPSYLLMASIDNSLQYVENVGKEAFAQFRDNFVQMSRELAKCRCLKFLPLDCKSQDVGKLLISVKGTRITGKQLYDILREKYHLQLEMAQATFCLAMFTVNDGVEAYERMTRALLEVENELATLQDSTAPENNLVGYYERNRGKNSLPLHEAWDATAEMVPLKDSVGKVMAEFINLYPPGVPLLVPGEVMTEELLKNIVQAVEVGLNVQGIELDSKYVEGKGVTQNAVQKGIFIKVLA